MNDQMIIKVTLFIFFIILLQRCRLFQILEVKFINIIAGIFLCITLISSLINTWEDDKTEIIVDIPSIIIMQDFYDNFSDLYNDLHVPEELSKEFMKNEIYVNKILENQQDELNIIINVKELFYSYLDKSDYQQDESESDINFYFNAGVFNRLKSWLWCIIVALFLYLFYSYSLFPRYCNLIERQIKDYGHILMGINTLEDILISVNVIKESVLQKSNLSSFIKNEIQNKKSGIYYLLGQAGEGKTVALKQIALLLIDERRRIALTKNKLIKIPIFMSIAEIENFEETKFEEQLCKNMIKVYLGKKLIFLSNWLYERSKRVFSYYLKRGKFIFLLDGYDEINENKRYELVCLLEKIIKKNLNSIYIISSRTYVFKEDNYPIFNMGTVLSLSALNKEQIYEFINKWNFKHKQASELYHKISNNSQLGHLATNALILTLICYMFDYNVQIEHKTVADFYFEASRCLLKVWEEDKSIQKRVKLPISVKQEALSAFAYFQLEENLTWCTKEEVIKAFTKSAQKNGITPISILEEISIQSGILESTPIGKYKFYHRSFYEFYAALYMFNNEINLDKVEEEVELYGNLISFYLSMKNEIKLTTKVLQRHKDKQKFVSQIMRYCEVDDIYFIEEHVKNCLENIENYNTSLFKDIGELAYKYPYIRNLVKERVIQIYENDNMIQTRQNCFITLTYFENSVYLAKFLVNNFSAQNAVEIILMSDDTIDNIIFYLVNENLGLYYLNEVFNGIAKAYKYDLLLRLIIGSKEEKIKELIMGSFLHCTKEKVFLDWLENKDLILYEKKESVNQINNFVRKYKWCNEKFSSNIIVNLYVIIWYALKLLDNKNYHFNLKKIDNGVKFIITYLKNIKKINEVKNYLIDIKDFSVVSLVEFDFHWKKARKRKINMLGKDPIFMNNLVLAGIMLSNLILVFYYLSRIHDLPILLNRRSMLEKTLAETFFVNVEIFKRYDVVIIQISRFFHFNSLYFLIAIGLNIVQKFFHNWLSQIIFKKYYVIFHFLIMLTVLYIYFTLIQDVNFRSVYALLAFFIMVIGIVQHKNNYPTFKNPLFTRIRRYLH